MLDCGWPDFLPPCVLLEPRPSFRDVGSGKMVPSMINRAGTTQLPLVSARHDPSPGKRPR